VGGKTGINSSGYKNEVGTFKEPVAVIINTDYLKTIGLNDFKSGFAEMIKHGLIFSTSHLNDLKNFSYENIDYDRLQKLIADSVEIKSYFVANDPTEKGIRKALNFGHTVGHAFESFSLQQNRPVEHGYAVAFGMIAELWISVIKCGFPANEFENLVKWMMQMYGKFRIEKDDFDKLYNLMTHDKKNDSDRINFTLLTAPGIMKIDQHGDKQLIFEALEYYRETAKL
jgi:3-dehydroquinate synthase